MVSFSKIEIEGWRQYDHIDIDFHENLTILTGSNGSGKSTILNILRSYLKVDSENKFIATLNPDGQKRKYSLGEWSDSFLSKFFPSLKREQKDTSIVGNIIYSNNVRSNLSLPNQDNLQFSLQKTNPEEINGVFMGSHLVGPRYDSIKSIPIQGIDPQEALSEYQSIRRSNQDITAYFRNGTHVQFSPLGSIKEALISFVMVGVGNKHLEPRAKLVGLFEKFSRLLEGILPHEIGFKRLEIRSPEVIVETSSGSFPIDGSSGGIMSIIHAAWQLFLSEEIYGKRFVAIIDEPENHLHPSMQRTFLSSLVTAFPEVQFIVATHSPFIISSVESSHVYALRALTSDGSSVHSSAPRSIRSIKLDQIHKSGPSSEILREVLGVPMTIPDWSARKLKEITEFFSSAELSKESLNLLRQQLKSAGLEEFFADAVRAIVQ